MKYNITNSVFRYPGGKKKLLPVIMDCVEPLLTNADTFCDAFVGGGSVALAVASKYPKINILLNDKDYWIYSFWDVVAGSSTDRIEELLSLLEVKPTIELFFKLREEHSTDKLRCAYKAIFFNRTAFSGILKSGPIGGKNQTSKYTVDCRFNSINLKKKILQIHKLLYGRTVVSNEDINQYIKHIDCPLYLDPPYFKAGKELYNEYMSIEEHQQMASLLKNKNKWVLSYDDAPQIIEMYQYANISKIDADYCINGEKIKWAQKSELIITPNN